MSEHTPLPERYSIKPPTLEGVPDYLQPSEIERVRYKQLVARHEALKALSERDRLSNDQEHAICLEIIDAHLQSAGLASGSDEYDKVRAILEESAVDSIAEKDWFNSREEDGNKLPSRRVEIFEKIERSYAHPEPKSDTAEHEPAEDTERRERVNQLAKKKQEAYVKLIGMPFYKLSERKQAKTDYETALQDYAASLREIGILDIQGAADTDKKSVLERLAQQFTETMQSDANDEQRLFIEQGGKKAKMLEWYAKQTTWKKIGLGVAAGVGLGGVGFLAGMAGLGAGMAAVVGGGLAAGRTSRVYLASLSRMYRDSPKGIEAMDFQHSELLDNDQAADLLKEYITRVSNDRVKSAERTRKVAIGWAIGSIATGAAMATAGAAIHTGEWQGMKFWRNPAGDNMSDRNLFGNEQDDKKVITLGAAAQPNEGTLPSNGLRYAAADNPISKPASEHELSGAFDVEKGHGLTHELTQSVNNAYGVKLSNAESWQLHTYLIDHAGKDYIDLKGAAGADVYSMGGGTYDVGIKAPGKASWEAGVPELIGKWMSEHHPGTAHSSVAESASDSLKTIKPGEGVLQSLKDAGVENPTLQDVSAVQDQLVTDGAAYANGPGGYAGLNMPQEGTMNNAGVETLMDYADNKKLDGSVSLNASGEVVSVDAKDDVIGSGADSVTIGELQGVAEVQNDHLTYMEMADLRQDVHEMSDMLRLGNSEAINANIDKLNTNADYQNALKYMADDLKSITYPDSSVPIISQNFTLGGGEWKINAIPKGSYMPHKVINTLIAYEQSRFALAA